MPWLKQRGRRVTVHHARNSTSLNKQFDTFGISFARRRFHESESFYLVFATWELSFQSYKIVFKTSSNTREKYEHAFKFSSINIYIRIIIFCNYVI